MISILEQLGLCRQYNTGKNNNSLYVELNFSVTKTSLVNAVKRIMAHHPFLAVRYDVAENKKYRIKITAAFINTRIQEFHNEDNQALLEDSQNKSLNLAKGLCWRILLNQCQEKSNIIFTISHVAGDGVSLSIVGNLLLDLLSKRYHLYFLKTIVIKILDCCNFFQSNHLASKTKFLIFGNPDDVNTSNAIVKIHHSIFPLTDTQYKKIKTMRLNLFITSVALLAAHHAYPEEQVIKLGNNISLRSRIPGVHRYKLGEYHIITTNFYNKKELLSLSEIEKAIQSRAKSIPTAIKKALFELRQTLSEPIDIVDYFSQHFQVKNLHVGISTFGCIKLPQNINKMIGITSANCGPKPRITFIASIINKKDLAISIQYNDRYTSINQLKKCISVVQDCLSHYK